MNALTVMFKRVSKELRCMQVAGSFGYVFVATIFSYESKHCQTC